jgi:hypothetical protein
MRIAVTTILVAASASLNGQSGGFGVPQLAVIYRAETGTLHRVSGVARANRTGAAIASVPKLATAVVAHNGAYAIGVTEPGKVVLVRLGEGEAKVMELPDLDSPAAIVVSPRSGSAAVRTGADLVVFTGLTQGELRRRSVRGEAGQVAVSDDGDLVAVAPARRSVVEIWNAQTGAVLEIPATGVTELRFVAGRADLLIAANSGYFLVRDGVAVRLPAAELDGRPVGVASSCDGQFYFLATTDGRVARIDSRDLTGTIFDCGCAIQRFQPGSGTARFEIGRVGERRVYLDWSDSPSLFSIQEARQ